MSWHVVAAVAERKVGSHARRLLLITMADKANRDGSGIYASVSTLARESEITDRTVQRLMKEFTDEGLIKLVGKRSCKGGHTNEYDIDLEVVEKLPVLENKYVRRESVSGDMIAPVTQRHPPAIAAKAETKSISGGATKSPVTPRRPRGVTMSPKPILEPFSLSSNEDRDAPSTKAKPHSMKEDWAPAEATRAYALKLGFADWEIDAAATECRDFWLDHPKEKRPGWERTFQARLRDLVDDRSKRAKLRHIKPGVVDQAELNRRLANFRLDGSWQDSWGPKPKRMNGHDERQAA